MNCAFGFANYRLLTYDVMGDLFGLNNIVDINFS